MTTSSTIDGSDPFISNVICLPSIMPVIIRDINWEETDANLVLHIPMKGAKATKLDVLSSNQYLKVRCKENC